MLTWLALAALTLFSIAAHMAARRRAVAAPIGLDSPIKLSECAAPWTRSAVKPMLVAGPTGGVFTNPRDNRTQDYIIGRFG